MKYAPLLPAGGVAPLNEEMSCLGRHACAQVSPAKVNVMLILQEKPRRAALAAPAHMWHRALAAPLRHAARLAQGLAVVAGLAWLPAAQAADTVCANVKIEIKQELTLERQAFDAEMKINNGGQGMAVESISVEVKVQDESGAPIVVSRDPNAVGAAFFIRVASLQDIGGVDGQGRVEGGKTGIANWLLIPAPGAGGSSPAGKKYLVGATLKYRYGGKEEVVEVTPDVITVKPLPLLTLDYFLPRDVNADDPLSTDIEAVEPFTLGVRVKNTGMAAAKKLKIDSAQPKIIENKQGLLISFRLTGSYVNDMPAANSLLIDFGDIAASQSKVGRWVMETSLSGRFTEFTARFSHADELGGQLTSLIQAVNTHELIRDVRVDMPGRDTVRDFLARDGDVLRVYESDSNDTVVTDRSVQARLVQDGEQGDFRLELPQTAGFVYAKLRDPFAGQRPLGSVLRSDAKAMLAENIWLSKSLNKESKRWEHWINVFDSHTTGVYLTRFKPAELPEDKPPVLQFVPDRTVSEGKQVAFLVEASSPGGKPLLLQASPLPPGASFVQQQADPSKPGHASAVFEWIPAKGSKGVYPIRFSANDGTRSASRDATINVEEEAAPPGPLTPAISAPLAGAEVTTLQPVLAVLASSNTKDPTKQIQFELYADEAMTQMVASATIAKAAPGAGNGADSPVQPTEWKPATALQDNTSYWWRARGFDGAQAYSTWANGRFTVNLYNDAPEPFNLSSPAANAEVDTVTPLLSWSNALDKDGDTVRYDVLVYRDIALKELFASATDIAGGEDGSSHWQLDKALRNRDKVYWRVVAKDSKGAETLSAARPLVVNTGNVAPTLPAIVEPLTGGQSSALPATMLLVRNSIDGDGDLIRYQFELDTVSSFDSGDKRGSGWLMQESGDTTGWLVDKLVENQRYFWRVKASDGRAETDWILADFLMNARNDAPPVPTVRNPGNGAWVSSRQPSLEANPVQDPEAGELFYDFEIYRDAGLKLLVASGSSSNTALIVPLELADKSSHWWRVRGRDAQGAISAWSPAALMYVSTGSYQEPTIQVTAPATPVLPVLNGERKTVTLRWEGTDPNIEPTVALYYGTSKTGYNGNLIVDGLHQSAGMHSGSYEWDVSRLAPGTYYVYAVLYDSKGMGRAYAPGAVVIPPASQSGRVDVQAGLLLLTSEAGGKFSFTTRLANAPSSDVSVPVSSSMSREARVEPSVLVFTPKNWNQKQTVTVTGLDDCVPDGNQAYSVQVGRAVSLDPNYMGLSGKTLKATNLDNLDRRNTTNNGNVHICQVKVISERKLNRTTWEYTLAAQLTNMGPSFSKLSARLVQSPLGTSIGDAVLEFGAVAQGEVGKSADTITLRANLPIPQAVLGLGLGYKWNVTVQP